MRQLLIVLMCASAAAVAAQTPSSTPQGPTFRTGVDVIAVDVAVVDDRGRPLDDLHAADFTVKIDGEPRRVVSAQLVKVDVEAAKKQAADKTETFFTSNLTPPQGRQIVIAIDQMNVRPGATRAVMAAAERFLDKLSPLDQVAFIAYPEPGPRVSFTTDRLKLRLAMESLIGHGVREQQGQLNIGISEAIAISEKRDQFMLQQVIRRECTKFGANELEQCQRTIADESSQIVYRARQDAQQSIIGLRTLLDQLATVDGAKSMILLSQGLAADRINDLDEIVRRAALARVAMNVLILDSPRGDVTVVSETPTPFDDRLLEVGGLQHVAAMSRGAIFHVVGNGEGIFERLASEISAYYLLGVEQRPNDQDGQRRRIDVQVGRRGAIIRSRQAFVLSHAAHAKTSIPDNVREVLASPFAVSGVPLRVTTFASQDPAGGKVRLMIAADVGEAGAKPDTYGVGYVLIDREGKVVGSFGQTLPLASGGADASLEFVGGVVVEPGIYELRLAVADESGRRGSVIREVNAWKMAGEQLAFGDLIVGTMPSPSRGVRAAVEPHVSGDAVAAYVELYAMNAATFDGASVAFEVADDVDGPPLVTGTGSLGPGAQATWRVAQGLVAARILPAGHYVARARVVRNGSTVSVLSRPFVLDREATSRVALASTPARFDRDSVLQPDLLDPVLQLLERRSPALKAALVDARAGRFGPAALEALTAGDSTAASLLRGIDLYAKGQLNDAATQLQAAAGPRRDFFPAALYLGACYAAAGRDRDAAGVWQFALGTEPRPPRIYALAADARMRDGQAPSAIDILKPAYERTPTDDQVGRRLALAYVATGQPDQALRITDAYLERQPADAEILFAAIVSRYETMRAGQALSNIDRERVHRYRAAYTGAQKALLDKYVALLDGR